MTEDAKAEAMRLATEAGALHAQFKACRNCGQIKPLDDFSIHRGRGHANGREARCRECMKAVYAVRNSDPARMEKIKAAALARQKTKIKEHRASMRVRQAVKDGRLTKLPCIICGGDSEGHHPDYDRPLEVVWLCRSHHQQVHKMVQQ